LKPQIQTFSIIAFSIFAILGGDYGIRYLMKSMSEKVDMSEFQSLQERVAKLEMKGGMTHTPTVGSSIPSPLPLPVEANAIPIAAIRKLQTAIPHPPSEDSGVTPEASPFKLLSSVTEAVAENPKSRFKLLDHE
jgi:hypothetical protein